MLRRSSTHRLPVDRSGLCQMPDGHFRHMINPCNPINCPNYSDGWCEWDFATNTIFPASSNCPLLKEGSLSPPQNWLRPMAYPADQSIMTVWQESTHTPNMQSTQKAITAPIRSKPTFRSILARPGETSTTIARQHLGITSARHSSLHTVIIIRSASVAGA